MEKFVRPASLQRLDRFAGRYGVFFFMVCFMIPIFQADAMNYVAGLSSLSARKFFVANLLGRLPGVVVMTAIGAFGLALSRRFDHLRRRGGHLIGDRPAGSQETRF